MNISKIRGKMAEKGYNMSSLSERLSVSRNTLSSYFKNPKKMPYDIIEQLATILFDSIDEAFPVFFT